MMATFQSALSLLRAALSEAAGDLPGVVVAGALLMVLTVGGQQYLHDEAGIVMIASLAAFLAQYWLTRRALDRDGLRLGRSVVALYFGMCLISGLAILAGLALLILPGIWLAARWIAAGPILFCEDVGALDALRRSASLAKGRMVPIMIVLSLASVPVLLALALLFVRDEYDLVMSITENAAFTVSQFVFWYVAVVVYREVRVSGAPSGA